MIISNGSAPAAMAVDGFYFYLSESLHNLRMKTNKSQSIIQEENSPVIR